MKWKIKPLTMEAWMILDDPTTQPQALAQDLPLLLLLFFFSQTPSFSSQISILVLSSQWKEKEKKNGFYNLFSY